MCHKATRRARSDRRSQNVGCSMLSRHATLAERLELPLRERNRMLLAARDAPSYARSSVTTSATRAPAPRRNPAPVSSPFRFGFVAKRAELGFISTVATFGTAVEITITVGTAWILLQAGVVALFAAALQTAI